MTCISPRAPTEDSTPGRNELSFRITEAISAVKVMMKVLVPTAVFSSIPKNTVNTISIIMPPPVPTKPVPNPIGIPKNSERSTPFQPSFAPFST